jgi:hypothetical protein
MAKRLTIDGYGQLELNNVAFRRDGRIEAQLPLDEVDFATKVAENGMLLTVDRVKGCIRFYEEGDKTVALNYTTEHMYDERKPGLKNFALKRGEFYPRLGYLAEGDKFTTNCVTLADGVTEDAMVGKYGVPSGDGTILLQANAGEGLCLQAIEKTTMPDGQVAVKFIVISC